MFRALKVDDKKAQSLVTWAIKKPRLPQSVVIPLRWGREPAAEACVEEGQHVLAGEKIASAVRPEAVSRYTPFSGKVVRIAYQPHPELGEVPAIEIHGGEFPEGFTPHSPAVFFKEEALSFFRDMGLVDLSETMEPLHTKIETARHPRLEILVLNGCDPEPYITANHSLAMSHALEILKGAEILRQACGARRIVLAFQQNQMEAAEIVKSKIFLMHWEHMEVSMQPSAYPHGLDALVLRDVLKTRSLSAASEDKRALLLNMATAFAVYEAAELGKPFFERTMTVGGECVVEAKNVRVPLGTRLEDVFRFSGGLLRDPGRVLLNGPMRGQAQTSLKVPVLPGTAAVLAIAKELLDSRESVPCDRCGLCVEACPAGLSPGQIALAVQHSDWEAVTSASAGECIECGACAFVCPSRVPLGSLMAEAKQALQLSGKPSRRSQPAPETVPAGSFQ